MTKEEMKRILDEIAAHLDVIYRAEKHWAKEWKRGDTGMKMFPSASSPAIAQLEQKMGAQLPPSYREFLSITDGCEHFWDDFTFRGTSGDHSKKVADKIREYMDWQKDKLIRTNGKIDAAAVDAWERANARNLYLERHLPIGTTFGGDVYVFDARTRQSDGEMEIVFWDLSFGAWEDRRYKSFGALLTQTLSEVTERAQKYEKKGKAEGTLGKQSTQKTALKKSPKKLTPKGR